MKPLGILVAALAILLVGCGTFECRCYEGRRFRQTMFSGSSTESALACSSFCGGRP